jgi:hypothetical protein
MIEVALLLRIEQPSMDVTEEAGFVSQIAITLESFIGDAANWRGFVFGEVVWEEKVTT